MSNTIIIKNSSTVSDVPTVGQLEQGELALNLLDEKLYSKNSSDLIFEIGGGGGNPATPHDIIGDINLATPPVAAAFTGLIRIVDNDETDVAAEFGFDGDGGGVIQNLYVRNTVTNGMTVFENDNFGGTQTETLRLWGGRGTQPGQEAYIMANRGIFNYLGSQTSSRDDPPLLVTNSGGTEDGQTASNLSFWYNSIQAYTASMAAGSTLHINAIHGGDVNIGNQSGGGTGGTIILGHDLLWNQRTATDGFVTSWRSSTAPSGGTVPNDSFYKISSHAQAVAIEMGARASDNSAVLTHEIHGAPWIIEGQNESGNLRKIAVFETTQAISGVYIGEVNQQSALWIWEETDGLTAQAGWGQIYVKSGSPNTLWFRDDAGTDFQLGGGAEVNDLTSAVTWDDIPIANVPTGTSSVTVALGDHGHTTLPHGVTIQNSAGSTQIFFNDAADGLRWRIGCNGDGTDDFIIYDEDQTKVIMSIDDTSGAISLFDTVSLNSALTSTSSLAVSDGTDTLSFSASAGAALFQPTGGMNSAEFNIRLIISDKLTVNNIFLDERASAGTDVTGDGQIWARNDPSQTLWFTPEGGTDYPIGYNSMPPIAVSASQNMLLAQVGYMLHKSSGAAITLTCAQDSSTWDGATWAVHNDDTEDLTIAAGASVTVYWIEAGSAPAAGSVTVEQGGLVTVYKLSNTEFWVWGGKETNPGLTYPLTPQDNEKIIFGTGSDAEIYSNGTDLYIDLGTSADFRLRGGAADDIMITAFPNSFVQLAYDGVVKLSTVSAGVNIVGTLAADDEISVEQGTQTFDIGLSGSLATITSTGASPKNIEIAAPTITLKANNTETALIAAANGAVSLYHNGGLEFRTQQHEASSVTSGAEVYDHAGTLRDVGFNHVKEVAVTASVTLSNLHAGTIMRKSDGGTWIITMASSSTEFPIGSMCTIINHGSAGSLTISDGAEDMWVMDGGGAMVNHAGFVLALAGSLTVWRQAASTYYVWGAGIP